MLSRLASSTWMDEGEEDKVTVKSFSISSSDAASSEVSLKKLEFNITHV